ncbi:hypothetical protein EGQ50_02605 [Coxiella endosymbiont of Amblyomma sculptum]|nr:hypothetical protein EGQ50_02605 [Coxiella endosymbiont of Amblyomma sculptum]
MLWSRSKTYIVSSCGGFENTSSTEDNIIEKDKGREKKREKYPICFYMHKIVLPKTVREIQSRWINLEKQQEK